MKKMLRMSNVKFVKSNENSYFENYKKLEIYYQEFSKDKINPRQLKHFNEIRKKPKVFKRL